MAVDSLIFVSKRVSVVVAALLCLTAVQLIGAAASAAPASTTEVRVAVERKAVTPAEVGCGGCSPHPTLSPRGRGL